jgi:hypothetical protein
MATAPRPISSADSGTPAKGAITTVEREYVEHIRATFRSQPCIQAAFSTADADLALHLCRRSVPLQLVENAILLGCSRKYVSGINRGSGAPIVSLRYFEAVLEEITKQPVSQSYFDNLRRGLPKLERAWMNAKGQSN